MGMIAFILSIISAFMIFFESLRLPAFVIAIFGVIFGAVAGYQKEKKDEKENKDKPAQKKSVLFEVAAVIISGAVCVGYLVLLYVA